MNQVVKVIKGTTIYKTKKWWCAVLLANMFGKNKVLIYLWQWNSDKNSWKRKQKMGINSATNWDEIKRVINEYVPEL